jgi:hypothetical protein
MLTIVDLNRNEELSSSDMSAVHGGYWMTQVLQNIAIFPSLPDPVYTLSVPVRTVAQDTVQTGPS